MRRMFVLLFAMLGVATAMAQTKPTSLDIYYIDTEGGQATLYVGPGGESLLVDTGNAGPRDFGRIVEVLDLAGVKRIDHLLTTHYHGDHYGALLELSKRMPVGRYYDHGENIEKRENFTAFRTAYEEVSKGKRTVLKPGDKIPLAGVDISVVMSDSQPLTRNLPGGGVANPACAQFQPRDESAVDPDNHQSVGFVLTHGRFRTINLGDLTWSREFTLMCPTNRIGTVDLYLTSHHGLNQSGSPVLVHALAPRVAVQNNGTRKGGAPETFQTLYSSPGLEDVWQLHWSHNVGLEYNAPGVFIANVEDNQTIAGILAPPPAAPAPPAGAPGAAPPGAGARGGAGGRGGGAAAHTPAHWIKVSALANGTFTVTNSRNGFSKTYRPRD
jgi:competence protein ComEC